MHIFEKSQKCSGKYLKKVFEIFLGANTRIDWHNKV